MGVKYIEKVSYLQSLHVELVLTINLDTLEIQRNISMKLFSSISYLIQSLELDRGFLVRFVALV